MRDSDRWAVIEDFIGKSSKVMIKKLSRNDCSWADGLSHQSGPYIPQEIQDSGFFPPLQNIDASKPHIFVCRLTTLWPATGEIKDSRIRHFSNKGSEFHFTRVPKEEFAELTPASLLIGGILREAEGGASHWFATVDSASELAELLESMFDLGADFRFRLFDPRDAFRVETDNLEQLIRDISAALSDGRLDEFVRDASRMPSPELLARSAQTTYMESEGLSHLDPFVLPNPGDVLMKISRDVEYRLYKKAETRRRAAEVIRTLWDGKQDIVSAVVRNLPALDAIFLSATQQRRSRAGRSFEQHIARLLTDGRVDFAEQVVTGGRRPDFILPRLKTFRSKVRQFDEALACLPRRLSGNDGSRSLLSD